MVLVISQWRCPDGESSWHRVKLFFLVRDLVNFFYQNLSDFIYIADSHIADVDWNTKTRRTSRVNAIYVEDHDASKRVNNSIG